MSGSYSQKISKKRFNISVSSLQDKTSLSTPSTGFATRIRVLCPLYSGSKEKLIMIIGETSGEGIPPSRGRHSMSKDRYLRGAIARLSTLFKPDARIEESHAKFSQRESTSRTFPEIFRRVHRTFLLQKPRPCLQDRCQLKNDF